MVLYSETFKKGGILAEEIHRTKHAASPDMQRGSLEIEEVLEMGPNEYITEDAMAQAAQDLAERHPHGIPIYLEGRTVIGRGTISADGRHIDIDIISDTPLADLISENLIGLSTMSIGSKDRTEEVLTKHKEKKDV